MIFFLKKIYFEITFFQSEEKNNKSEFLTLSESFANAKICDGKGNTSLLPQNSWLGMKLVQKEK